MRKAAVHQAVSCEEMEMLLTFNIGGYPRQYESLLALKNGEKVFLRPIRQTDENLIVDLLNKLSADSVYLRFLRPIKTLSEELLFQLTHINYSSNFALVAVIKENGKDSIIAVSRYGYDPKAEITDFAIVVRDDWQHFGLGKLLLTKTFAIGREHGISRFETVMDSTNTVMKQILRELGNTVKYSYRGGATQVEVFV